MATDRVEGEKPAVRAVRPSKRAAPPRSKSDDKRRLTSAANLPRMAGWNRWRPVRRIIDVPGEEQRQQTESEAMEQARALVLEQATAGARQADIARLLFPPMDPATLRRHFRHELALGRERQLVDLAAAFQMALSGADLMMARFLPQGGWPIEAAALTAHTAIPSIPGDDRL